MTLRTRIAAAAGLAVALTVVLVAVAVYVGVRAELRGEVDDSLRERAERTAAIGDRGGPGLGALLGRGPRGRGDLFPPEPPPTRFGGAQGFTQLVLPSGRALRRPGSGDSVPVSARAREIARTGSGQQLTDTTVAGTHLRVLTVALPRGGALQFARPLDEIDRQLDQIALVLLLVGATGVALGAGLGALVARAALAPIARFTRGTERIADDPDPSHRIEVSGRDELARLARSFNATLDALERSVEAQRQLVADASHELRTPIASLRANVQTLEEADRLPLRERDGLRRDVVQELDELTALVADVVELARGTKLAEQVDEVRLDRVVRAVVERARSRAGERVSLSVRAEPAVVRGEPARIQRAISNLVDNAVKWSAPGGAVEVELAQGVVSVRDHGPGFEAKDLPRVFERFYRADGARAMPGSGLGLAIVCQTAEAHGGSVSAVNASGGGGLVTVSFGPANSVQGPGGRRA